MCRKWITENGQVVVSSREVAENFGKRHADVVKRNYTFIKKWGGDNIANLFFEQTYVHKQNKQEYKEYLMNRDGFSLLVMVRLYWYNRKFDSTAIDKVNS